MSARFPESDARKQLVLEEGLSQARAGDSRAEATLQRFVRDFPDHPRRSEARLALAEIAIASKPPNPSGAQAYLKAAYETSPNQETEERAEYLAMLVADAAGCRDEDKVIADCLAFIKKRPGSALVPEVRMKLGQVYYHRQDFAAAQTQFELIARESPGSPFAETATFLAGRSAMSTMSTENMDPGAETF